MGFYWEKMIDGFFSFGKKKNLSELVKLGIWSLVLLIYICVFN